MSDALGVGAFLESSDGQVVLLKRGEHLAEAPGLWDIPGGHPEPQVMTSRCTSNIWNHVLKSWITTVNIFEILEVSLVECITYSTASMCKSEE